MNRIYPAFLLIAICCLSLTLPAQRPAQIPLLKNGQLPANSGMLHQKLGNTAWKSAHFGNKYFLLVHFDQIPDPEQRKDLASRGLFLDQYVAGNNWLARWSDDRGLKELQGRSIGGLYALPPELKISPKLKNIPPDEQTSDDLIAVSYFAGTDPLQVQKELQNAGADIVLMKIKPAYTVFIRNGMQALQKLAKLPFVVSINPQRIRDVPLNNNNRALHGVQALSAYGGRNLRGRGVTVGIGDDGEPSSHIDFTGRLVMRTGEPVSDAHGVHTSGTVGGAGILNPLYRGMAPEARLVTNDFSNILVNTPIYFSDYNMVLTNNSYFSGLAGCPGEGDYDALSNYVDSELSAFPKMMHVFAAGNDGGTTCAPFPTAFATIKSGFQTAKNVLTVGGFNNSNYAVYAGTSRGPVDDGRIKPEVVAGAVNVVSTLPGNAYGGLTGTSMASPTVTGILALLYERYRQLNSGSDPDAALIKTLVSNSADDQGNPGPDFTFGFGMINARTSVEAMEQHHYFTGSATNNGISHFTIPSMPAGALQLKIMLYWADPAAQPFAPSTLVNDLDLTVTDPSGTNHLPMVLDPSPQNVNNNAVEGADHLNNIEQVLINNPPAGNFTVSVKGYAVPQGPQSFYVAYEIIQPSVTVEYPFGTETLVPGETTNIRWSAYGADSDPFTVEYSTDGAGSWNLISNSVASGSRSFACTVPNTASKNALIRVTRNGAGYSDMSDFPFIILGQPLISLSKPCPGYAQLIWKTIPGADQYQIMELKADSMEVIASTTDTSYLVTTLHEDSSYWFGVRALTSGAAGRRSVAANIIPNDGPCTLAALDNDLVMDGLKTPVTGREFTSSRLGNTQVQVIVRNSGSVATSAPVTLSYQVNGGPVVTEVLAGSIPSHTDDTFTFSPADSYDFSAPGVYTVKTWTGYSLDPVNSNDTVTTIVKQLRNAPLVLNPSFAEGFELAPDQTLTMGKNGLDSLDRVDFSNSNSHGRLSTFFNSGFARTGNRCITLDVINSGAIAADSLTCTFNLSSYSASDQIWLDLYFKKQSIAIPYPGNRIWIRGNDQAAWIQVKDLNDNTDPNGVYIHVNVDVTGALAAASPAQTVSSSFQVRCGSEGSTPSASPIPGGLPGGGISFDDFLLTRSQDDAGITRVLQPVLKNICSLSGTEKITVVVRNYGTDSLLNIPVSYAINTDTVTEIIPFIKAKDSVIYTFSKTGNMSAFRLYNVRTWVSYAADNYHNNDSSQLYSIYTTPLIDQYPYLEGFENNNGYWFTGGANSSWQWGKPQKTIIHKAANGSNAWVTHLAGNYNDNEYSYLYSPCFDLSSLTKPVLSFSHIFKMEDGCDCDFHWVEYSLDDSIWTILGDAGAGVNWYDKASPKAWQISNPRWHVSSYDIPVNAAKIRFRIVMFSDPGTNNEGVGIDDVHIFDKAPVYADSTAATIALPVSGSGWTDFDQNGKRILSLNPNGQDLGNVRLSLFIDSGAVRDTAGQYYLGRNWVIQPSVKPGTNVSVRYYFTDSEMNKLLTATGCPDCSAPEDAYSAGITRYESPRAAEEDNVLYNNLTGSYLFNKPQQDVQVIPYDNGYYAETRVSSFSECWINAGGIKQDHPLAAWLKDFSAVPEGNGALLKWSTWQETGSYRFVIERSSDSISFSPIGFVSAKPHEDSVTDYQTTDPQLMGGHNYYRLKLLFVNGDSLYSPIRQVFFDPDPVQVRVFPNPTSGILNINSSAECRDIQIFDVSGRLLIRKETSGFQQSISLSLLARGVYLLKLDTDKGGKLLKIEKR